jgi:PAS domain S-box-containing protein
MTASYRKRLNLKQRQAEGVPPVPEGEILMLLESIGDAIVVTGGDGKYRYISPRLIKLFGVSEKEFRERTFIDYVHKEDRDELLAYYKRRMKGKRRVAHHVFRIMLKDGDVRWLETSSLMLSWSGEPAYLDFMKDITDRKRGEEEFKNTRNYLKNVFNSLPSVVITVDVDGVISGWNTAAERFTAIMGAEAVSRKVWEVIPYFKEYRPHFFRVIESQQPIELLRQSILIDDKRFLNISISPLVSNGTDGAVIRIDDVTELEIKTEQLRQAQRMETVGTLAGGLAHDFNNILGGILGTVSLMKYSFKKKGSINLAKIEKNMNTIEKAATRATDLVHQLLALSRKQEFAFAPIDLNQSLRHVMGICKNTFDKSIKLKTFFSDDGAMVKADPTQIEQVLLNLCVNAFHAMTVMKNKDEPQGGILIVSIERVYNNEYFRSSHPEVREGDYWCVRVMDTGVGMDAETMSKIYDPFFTTKDKTVGTGLGLAMVYNIVQQHDGFIDVYSQPGIGTTFTVFFPVLEGGEELATPVEKREELPKGSGSILIVDDEEIVRETASEILRECGYKVILAGSGEEAIEILKNEYKKIRVVILDISMSPVTGNGIFSQIQKISPQVKILISSGLRDDARIQAAMDMGVSGYIERPFTLYDLAKKIKLIIE